MLVLEGYGMLVPSRPMKKNLGRDIGCKGGQVKIGRNCVFPGTLKLKSRGGMPKPAPLRCPDGSLISKQGCKPKPTMLRPDSLKVPVVRPLIKPQVRPAKPAVMVKPSPMPDTALIEKAALEAPPEIKAPVITKPKQEGPSIATMAMIGIPLAVVTYFMAT